MYSSQLGGGYTFITEEENKRALPVDRQFWSDLYSNSTRYRAGHWE